MSTIFMNHKLAQMGFAAGNHGVVDYDTDTLQVALIDTGTNDPDYTVDQDWTDVVSGLIGALTSLASLTEVGSAPNVDLDAADTTISSVSGASAEELVLIMWSGANGTSPLLSQLDSGDVTNLPVTPNGGDITVVWNASGIMRF